MNINESKIKNNQEVPDDFYSLKNRPKTLEGYEITDGVYRNTSVPTITCGSAMGTSGREVATIEGDSTSGLITLTIGDHMSINELVCNITFSKPLKKIAYPVLMPASKELNKIIPHMYVSDITNTGFSIYRR